MKYTPGILREVLHSLIRKLGRRRNSLFGGPDETSPGPNTAF